MSNKLEEIRSREATHALTTRVDARYLATLIIFWKDQNCLPNSLSELSRLSLESFAEFLVSNKMVNFVENLEDALSIMKGVGLNPKRINPTYITKLLQKNSSVNTNFLNTPDPTHEYRKTVSSSPVSSLEINQVLAAMQKQESESAEDRVKLAQERAAEFSRGLGEIPEDFQTSTDEESND